MPTDLEIEWDVRKKRRFRGVAKSGITGIVRELSLDGALIELPIHCQHRVGEQLTVQYGDGLGQAQICHRRQTEDGNGILYGIQLVPDAMMREWLSVTVREVSGRPPRLQDTWERPR